LNIPPIPFLANDPHAVWLTLPEPRGTITAGVSSDAIMKHWQETSHLLALATRLGGAGLSTALATVVRIDGSAYRRPGAKMLVASDGTMAGSVSGGCLEADVREVALTLLRDGPPSLVHYDTGGDDATVWGLGLGCNGAVDVFVQPCLPASTALTRVRELLAENRPFALSTVIAHPHGPGARLTTEANGRLTGSTGDPAFDATTGARATRRLDTGETGIDVEGAIRIFTEIFEPPPHLVICGAGDDSLPLAIYAGDAGFRVTVVDHRPAYLATERFAPDVRLVERRPEEGLHDIPAGPDTYFVIKGHGLALDREWLRQALDTASPYIGVLGPRARAEGLLEQLGLPASERVFGPVGLDVAAEGPEQIALSVVAELLSVRAARPPRHLRDKETAIHAG
jgi:xanthine dehydrogenase accessory factor